MRRISGALLTVAGVLAGPLAVAAQAVRTATGPGHRDPVLTDLWVGLVFAGAAAYPLTQLACALALRGRWRRFALLPLLGMVPLYLWALFGGGSSASTWILVASPIALAWVLGMWLLAWWSRRRGD